MVARFVGVVGRSPPFAHRRFRPNCKQNQLQSSPSSGSGHRHHQDNWFKSYFVEWISIIITIVSSTITGGWRGRFVLFSLLDSNYRFSLQRRQMLFLAAIIKRFETKPPRQKKRINWTALGLDGKLVCSVLRFPIHFFVVPFVAHQSALQVEVELHWMLYSTTLPLLQSSPFPFARNCNYEFSFFYHSIERGIQLPTSSQQNVMHQ